MILFCWFMGEEHSIPAPSLSFKALEPAILPRASPRYKEAPWKEPSFRNGRFNDRNNEELNNSDHLETKIWKDRCSWENNAWHKKIHKSYNNVTIYIFNFSTQPSSTLTWQVHMVYLRDILHNPLSVGWKRPRCYGNKTEKTMSLSLLSSSQKCSKDYDDEMLLFIRIINPQAPNSRPN